MLLLKRLSEKFLLSSIYRLYLSSHIIEPSKETTTFAGGNPGTDLGQEQQYSGFKAINGIQTLSLSIIRYSTAIYM
jgi:hypothetical protein